MGLLDEMLGGVLGGAGQAPTGGGSQTASGGMSSVLMGPRLSALNANVIYLTSD